MRTALVYYSMSGNVEYVVKKIAEKIDVDIIRLEPVKDYPDKGFQKFFWGGKSAVMGEAPALAPYKFDGAQYDKVIIGTPVWASNYTPPIRTFINEHPEIAKKKISVFLCFSGGGADKAMARLRESAGVPAFAQELILVDPATKSSAEKDAQIEAFAAGV